MRQIRVYLHGQVQINLNGIALKFNNLEVGRTRTACTAHSHYTLQTNSKPKDRIKLLGRLFAQALVVLYYLLDHLFHEQVESENNKNKVAQMYA